MEILGVKIDNLEKQKILEKVEGFLRDGRQHYIVTPNPEFLVESRRDQKFKSILNHSDLSIADGTGLIFASWFLRQPVKQRMTGADLTESLLRTAQEKELSVFLVNWAGGLSSADSIKEAVQKKYPGLRFEVMDVEGRAAFCSMPIPPSATLTRSVGGRGTIQKKCLSRKAAQTFKPDILFVSLGAPYQEKFIYRNLKKIPSVKLAMGIGGAFDFISSRRKRAPKVMRSTGLEWLWRFFCQPRRVKRIYNAVAKFPLLVVKERLIHKRGSLI